MYSSGGDLAIVPSPTANTCTAYGEAGRMMSGLLATTAPSFTSPDSASRGPLPSCVERQRTVERQNGCASAEVAEHAGPQDEVVASQGDTPLKAIT